jgi:hypothetical protein
MLGSQIEGWSEAWVSALGILKLRLCQGHNFLCGEGEFFDLLFHGIGSLLRELFSSVLTIQRCSSGCQYFS